MKTFALCAAFAALLATAPLTYAKSETIVCKDGTQSEAEHMRGACSGHGGVDKKATKKAEKADKAAAKEDKAAAREDKETSATRKLGAAGTGKVWGNDDSKVYHCEGDRYYGKTKHGEYMTEAEAKSKGFRPDHGKACAQR